MTARRCDGERVADQVGHDPIEGASIGDELEAIGIGGRRLRAGRRFTVSRRFGGLDHLDRHTGGSLRPPGTAGRKREAARWHRSVPVAAPRHRDGAARPPRARRPVAPGGPPLRRSSGPPEWHRRRCAVPSDERGRIARDDRQRAFGGHGGGRRAATPRARAPISSSSAIALNRAVSSRTSPGPFEGQRPDADRRCGRSAVAAAKPAQRAVDGSHEEQRQRQPDERADDEHQRQCPHQVAQAPDHATDPGADSTIARGPATFAGRRTVAAYRCWLPSVNAIAPVTVVPRAASAGIAIGPVGAS